MIRGNRSTLAVYSEVRTVAEVTSVLGLEPHESNEMGEPTKAAPAGRDLRREAMVYQQTHWSFTEDESLVDPEDETGFSSLRVLIGLLRDRANALASLRPDCETIIWWSGDSDSSQGGFVMPADLLVDLALLGCDLYGTAYLIDEDDDE